MPQKRCQLLQSVFEEDEAEEAAKKKIKNQKKSKKRLKENQKKSDNFFLNFSKLPPKRCPGGRRLHPQRPQSVFEEDEAEVVAESSSSKCTTGYTYFVKLN